MPPRVVESDSDGCSVFSVPDEENDYKGDVEPVSIEALRLAAGYRFRPTSSYKCPASTLGGSCRLHSYSPLGMQESLRTQRAYCNWEKIPSQLGTIRQETYCKAATRGQDVEGSDSRRQGRSVARGRHLPNTCASNHSAYLTVAGNQSVAAAVSLPLSPSAA